MLEIFVCRIIEVDGVGEASSMRIAGSGNVSMCGLGHDCEVRGSGGEVGFRVRVDGAIKSGLAEDVDQRSSVKTSEVGWNGETEKVCWGGVAVKVLTGTREDGVECRM